MEKTEKDVLMKAFIQSKAQGYTVTLQKYETILTAEVFLRTFEQTSPLSKYLQTSVMVIVSEQHLATGTELEKVCPGLWGCDEGSRWLCWVGQWQSGEALGQWCWSSDCSLSLPEKRSRKHEREPAEVATDELIAQWAHELNVDILHLIKPQCALGYCYWKLYVGDLIVFKLGPSKCAQYWDCWTPSCTGQRSRVIN